MYHQYNVKYYVLCIIVKGAHMKDTADKDIDELFSKIRLKLLKLRESDPETTDELKNLLTQLEDWVEKLIIDSLRLRSLEKNPKSVKEP